MVDRMTTEHARLFLGFHLTSDYNVELNKINPDLKKLFVQNNLDYLQELMIADNQYLGKYLEKPANLSELELLEANIYSLLGKLVPDYPYSKQPLHLLPVYIGKKHFAA